MKENLDNLIKESMIAKTSDRTLLLRDIKTEFSKAETAKDFKKLDEIAQNLWWVWKLFMA